MKLRELKEKDAESILEWMQYPESKDIFAKDFNKFTLEEVKKFIKRKNNEQEMNFACVNDEDEYLGTVSLKNIDKKNSNAEYAISFLKKAQGTGAAKFATQEILRVAFNDLGLKKVYLNVLNTNQRAIKFYEKIGFEKEGVFREHVCKNDEFCDLVWYAILDSKWRNDFER